MAWTHIVQYSVWLILSFFVEDVLSGDYCTTERGLEYCQWTCCGSNKYQYCCMSPYTIAGIVFGSIALLCTIVATVFCICQYKKQKAQVATTQRIFVVNGANSQYQHSAYPYTTAGPLAPGYNTQYGMHFNGMNPPAYSTLRPQSKKGPTAHVYPATEPGAQPPPPPPAYTPLPQYPFAKAAQEAYTK